MRNVLGVLLVSMDIGACAAGQPERASGTTPPDSIVRFHARPGDALRRPDRLQLANVDGSPRVRSAAAYEHFWQTIAPEIEAWAQDPRLGINPGFVAALLAKESGFEPFAMSASPAFGYPQLTHIVDVDLQQMAEAEERSWMRAEVLSWPRHPRVHRPDATRHEVQALIENGTVTAGNEYFFDPLLSTRAAVFWIRLLEEVWTSHVWSGMYGRLARERLNAGAPLSESQLVDLVLVSYNQGYPYVLDLVDRHGREWTEHVNAEAADYVDRIRAYARLFST